MVSRPRACSGLHEPDVGDSRQTASRAASLLREELERQGSNATSSLTTNSSTLLRPSIDTSELPKTLYRMLFSHRVAFTNLKERHKSHESILRFIRHLISVAPNCAPIMEMWPTAFKTYSGMVPNFINLPFVLWNVAAPRCIIGLTLFISSRAAGCMYCSLHTCVFALRRGTSPTTLQGISLSPKESAVARTAYALSVLPCRLTESERCLLYEEFPESTVEWILAAVGMMGFLNRWMDMSGCDMEETAVCEAAPVLLSQGIQWTSGQHEITSPLDELQKPWKISFRGDTLSNNLKLFRLFPALLKYDAEITKDVPKSWPAVGSFLLQKTGHTFPILGKLKHSRVICAVATMISMNLNALECSLDLELKYLIAMVFAGVAKNRLLFEEFKKIALDLSPDMTIETIMAVSDYAWDDSPESMDFSRIDMDKTSLGPLESLSFGDRMILIFTKASSCAPPQMTRLVLEIADAYMTPPQIVEIITWVSLCNMLHRLYCFYFPGSFESTRLPYDSFEDSSFDESLQEEPIA